MSTDADAGAATSANYPGGADNVEVCYNVPGYAIGFGLVASIFALHVFWLGKCGALRAPSWGTCRRRGWRKTGTAATGRALASRCIKVHQGAVEV